jgi:hypothetical protein
MPVRFYSWRKMGYLEKITDQTKDYEIDICYFSTKYAALRRKSKDWFAQNLDTDLKLNRHFTLLNSMYILMTYTNG